VSTELLLRPDPEVERFAAALELAPPRRAPAAAGDRALARGGGSSPELLERRPYVLGDDLRRIDWRGSLAHERLLLKVFREERRPRLELLLDLSGSMAVEPAKAELAFDLAALAVRLARGGGFELGVWTLAAPPTRLELETLDREGLVFGGAQPNLESAIASLSPALRARSVRWIVTDALLPADPLAWLQPLARDADAVELVQVLAAHDVDPAWVGSVRLRDAESAEERELELDPPALARYRARFRRHQEALDEACRRCGVAHHVALAAAPTRAERLHHAVAALLAAGALRAL
jgi:uncharacterized protein (DUF58 family)